MLVQPSVAISFLLSHLSSQRVALAVIAILISTPAAFANETAPDLLSEKLAEQSAIETQQQSTIDEPAPTVDLLTQRLEAAVQNQIANDSEAAERSETALFALTETLGIEPGTAVLAVEDEPGAAALSGLTSISVDDVDVERDTGEITTDLVASLGSDNELTQLYAADALWSITQNSELVLPTLMSASESSDLQVQALAIEALTQLGKEALPAVPVLDRLANDGRAVAIARDAIALIRSENRPATALGILAREARRLPVVPVVIRALTGLWR